MKLLQHHTKSQIYTLLVIMINLPVFMQADPIPGGSLPPGDIPKYETPLLIPPVMPKAATIKQRCGNRIDYYEISMKEFDQQILPDSLPTTRVWGYGAIASERKNGLLIHNAPSLTIEACHNRPVRIKWINDLKDEQGHFLPHVLTKTVDQTLHWANPPGGKECRDTRPVWTKTPCAYTGPVPIVTHVHGAVGVGDESDGYTEAWYLPDATNIPKCYATKGTWYDFFKKKAASDYGVKWGKGFAIFQYPNENRASTLWYHDHALGMTRLNVYAGPAGFYIVRGGPSGDDAVIDIRTGKTAVLPGPAPTACDTFPSNKIYREIPIVVQDRSFNKDGSLFYPQSRAFFDGIAGPYIPDSDISPLWNPEFFGNTMMVNGNTWPYLDVERARYRFRLLNGCNSRFLILDFSDIPGISVWQIGNDGGFLAAPVNLTMTNGNKLLLGPAERADIIVDFAGVEGGNYILGNIGPDEPFGGGVPGVDFPVSDPSSTGQVMQFRIQNMVNADHTTPAEFLQLPLISQLSTVTNTRKLALLEKLSEDFEDAPSETLLGVVDANGFWTSKQWADPVTENPSIGATEIWELYNATADAHPIHIHEVAFEILNRQDIIVDEENQKVEVKPGSLPVGPESGETGFKDMVIAYPGQVTRIKAHFAKPGRFVWHCHIVEHEDNEMMRPYQIGPDQKGQPKS